MKCATDLCDSCKTQVEVPMAGLKHGAELMGVADEAAKSLMRQAGLV